MLFIVGWFKHFYIKGRRGEILDPLYIIGIAKTFLSQIPSKGLLKLQKNCMKLVFIILLSFTLIKKLNLLSVTNKNV